MTSLRALLPGFLLFLTSCEEAQYIVPFAIYSAAVGAGSATVTVEVVKKECNEKPTRHEMCQCWDARLSRLPTPRKCWGDGKGGYVYPP